MAAEHGGPRVLDGDEGQPPNPQVLLVLSEPEHFRAIAGGSAMRDAGRSWSQSASLRVTSASAAGLDLDIDVYNYGMAGSRNTMVRFVLWGLHVATGDLVTGTHAEMQVFKIGPSLDGAAPSTQTASIRIPAGRARWMRGGSTISESEVIVSHLHAMVADYPLDPLEGAATDFWNESRAGSVVAFPHIARLCRQVVCKSLLEPGRGAFSVAGNSISHLRRSPVEWAVADRDAGKNAGFGLQNDLWLGDLLGATLGEVRPGRVLPAGEIAFVLTSQLGTKLSTAADDCQINTENNGMVVRLRWEDGSDNDYNDFGILIAER